MGFIISRNVLYSSKLSPCHAELNSVKMAGYGQTSTSPASFSLDIGDIGDDQPPPYSQNYKNDNLNEFQFVQASSGTQISTKYRTVKAVNTYFFLTTKIK